MAVAVWVVYLSGWLFILWVLARAFRKNGR